MTLNKKRARADAISSPGPTFFKTRHEAGHTWGRWVADAKSSFSFHLFRGPFGCRGSCLPDIT